MSNNGVPAHATGQHSADIVIVGNGIAGLTAAVEARRIAPEKRTVIISEQSHPTINTPALKQFAIGKLEREQLLAYPVGTERAWHIEVLHGHVEEISARGKYVRLTNGGTVGYGSLLIATGSVAEGLPADLPGRDFDGALTLHRLQHYLDFRRRLHEVESAVVIGGGTHAVETVSCLLHLGIQTSWLIRGKSCLERVLDQRAGELVMRHIQQAGAKVYTETEVVGIAGSVGAVAGVVTNQRQMLPCQLILACTGTKPATELAESCDLPIMYERKRGIFVNNQLRTSAADIYAAGDVAALHNPQTGRHETRAQWYAAVVQGCTAAAMMTGHGMPTGQSFGVPWHATRLGELSLLTVGNVLGRTEGSITLSGSHKGTYRRLSMLDDRLIGYLSLGQAQADGQSIRRLIDEGHSIRALEEALLKGTFDGRKYFSGQRTRGAWPRVAARARPLRMDGRCDSSVDFCDVSAAESDLQQLERPLSIAGSFSGNLPAAPQRSVVPMVVSLPSSGGARLQSRSLLSYDRKRGRFLVEKGH